MKSKEQGILVPHQAIVLGTFKPHEAREKLRPGRYEASFMAQITGAVTVGEDYESQDPVPWKAIALRLLEDLNEEEAKRVIRKAVRQDKEADEVEEVVKMIAQPLLGKRDCKGRVSGSCVVRVVEDAP